MVIRHILESSEWIKGFQSSGATEGVAASQYLELEKVVEIEKRVKRRLFTNTSFFRHPECPQGRGTKQRKQR